MAATHFSKSPYPLTSKQLNAAFCVTVPEELEAFRAEVQKLEDAVQSIGDNFKPSCPLVAELVKSFLDDMKSGIIDAKHDSSFDMYHSEDDREQYDEPEVYQHQVRADYYYMQTGL